MRRSAGTRSAPRSSSGRIRRRESPNNAVYDIDEGISFYFDLGTGEWLLEDFWIERVPLELC